MLVILLDREVGGCTGWVHRVDALGRVSSIRFLFGFWNFYNF